MIWILLIHIAALLVWVGAVLYIPVLIASEARQPEQFSKLPNGMNSVARLIFSYIASPAAIVAIIAGTLVFVIADIVSFWLMVKLTIVAVMVCLHASLGLLITRLERGDIQRLRTFSILLFSALGVCAMCIIWLVLAKPDTPDAFPWAF